MQVSIGACFGAGAGAWTTQTFLSITENYADIKLWQKEIQEEIEHAHCLDEVCIR